MADKTLKPARTRHPFVVTLAVLFGIFLLALVLAAVIGVTALYGKPLRGEGNVAVIAIVGTIGGGEGAFSEGVSADSVIALIDEAKEDESITAIIFDIDSPGGSPVASADIADAVRTAGKPTVARIRDTGASGAYWIASATDHVVAHPLSVTGSIGVQGSYLEFSGLMERYGVRYERLVAGESKDVGSPFKPLTADERFAYEGKLAIMRDYFVKTVAANRNLTIEEVDAVADGMFLLGSEAYDAGLVDELGGEAQVTAYLEKAINATVVYVPFEEERTLADVLAQLSSDHGFAVGQGIGASLTGGSPTITT